MDTPIIFIMVVLIIIESNLLLLSMMVALYKRFIACISLYEMIIAELNKLLA